MKRYKEYRMLVVCILLALLALVLLVTSIVAGNMLRILASTILLFVALMQLATGYYIMVDDSYVVNYKWKVVALLPEMIEFENIQSIEVLSKHKIKIQHKTKSILHVLNSEKVYKELNKRMKAEKE